jgi:hypothetical protein
MINPFSRIRDWFADRIDGLGDARSPIMTTGIILSGLAAAWVVWFFAEYRIDDRASFTPPARFQVEGGSKAVSAAAALLDREMHEHTWAPNRPWFVPVSHSDNMKNYQTGMQFAVSRWADAMAEYFRGKGSTQADPDLIRAAGNLKYDPTIWVMGDGKLLPHTSAVGMYDEAIDRLMTYNQRIARGEAHYDRMQIDNLIRLLDRVSKDLGSQSDTLDLMISTPDDYTADEKKLFSTDQLRLLSSNGGYLDGRADDAFYATKGRLYAYYILLKATGDDFQQALEQRGAWHQWQRMLLSLKSASGLTSFFVSNGASMDLLLPSHLSNQGFYLLRADKQIKEVTEILSK